jgi:MYXO-CTERM domain-containing protein
VLSAEDAYARVVAQAGTCQHRDAVELRLIGQLTSLGTKGAIIGNESDVGGQSAVTQVTRPAGFDTDGDGIPDAWETAHGLNPNSASDGSGDSGDGYTNLEKYLNELADLACPGGTAPSPSDAGASQPADAAAVEAGATPGKDAAPQTSPDAAVLGSDAPRPDAGSPAGDVTVTRPDGAILASDAAGLPGDAPVTSPADTGPSAVDSRVSATADARPAAPPSSDAAGSASKSTTEPATTSSSCSYSIGSAGSRSDLGFLLLAMGLLLVARIRRR